MTLSLQLGSPSNRLEKLLGERIRNALISTYKGIAGNTKDFSFRINRGGESFASKNLSFSYYTFICSKQNRGYPCEINLKIRRQMNCLYK